MGTRRAVLEAGFAFLSEPFHPPVGGLAGNPHPSGGAGRGPTFQQDPINLRPNGVNFLQLVLTRASFDSRILVTHESNHGGPHTPRPLVHFSQITGPVRSFFSCFRGFLVPVGVEGAAVCLVGRRLGNT